MSKKLRHIGALAAGVAAASGIPSSAADAALNWKPNDTPENLGHYYLRESSVVGYAVDAYNNGADEVNRTILSVHKTAPGGAWNDVTVRITAVPNGNFADWGCITRWTSGSGQQHCDVSRIRYTDTADTAVNADYWKAVGCHEAAHSIGLGERPSGDASCERNPASGSVKLLGWDSIHQFDDNYVI